MKDEQWEVSMCTRTTYSFEKLISIAVLRIIILVRRINDPVDGIFKPRKESTVLATWEVHAKERDKMKHDREGICIMVQ